MQNIKVVMTMDCEPTTATSHPQATGPANWSAGEDAVRGYVDIAAGHGLPVTLFVHPEAAVAQSALFRELENKGACLGLHMHPWKYSLWRHHGHKYLAHYGGLSAIEQQEILQESSTIWAEAIGHRPYYFRPGTFSANDAIFQVLATQGFPRRLVHCPRAAHSRDAGDLDRRAAGSAPRERHLSPSTGRP